MAIKVNIREIEKLRRKFDNIDKEAAKVEKYTISDLKKRAPGMVSSATSQIYAIKKMEVARARSKTASKNAGKQHVRSSFKGKALDDFVMVFTGRKTATWNTKAKPKPKPPATGNNKIFSNRRKYKVTVEVFKGQPTQIKPTGKNRVFVMQKGGKLRPLIVGMDNKPRMKASTSVPQAIMNEKTVAIWRPQLLDYIVKRFKHHSKRYWAGEL